MTRGAAGILICALALLGAGCDDPVVERPPVDPAAIDTPLERCDAVCKLDARIGCDFHGVPFCVTTCVTSYVDAEEASGLCTVLFTAYLNCRLDSTVSCHEPPACNDLRKAAEACVFGQCLGEC